MPDVDPTTDGAVLDCQGAVPSLTGLQGAPSPVATTTPALAHTCQGCASLVLLDGTARLLAGTQNNLYQASVSSWSDVTRTAAAGGSYATVTGRWRFAEFGNVSIAASLQNTLQQFSGTFFSCLSGSPPADIIETVNQFVFLGHTAEAIHGDAPERWWCSALGDYTNYTPSQATQSATGELTSVPGPITAVRRLGDNIVIYKKLGLYLGVYTGPPFIWSFEEIAGTVAGAFCQEAVANIGTPEQPKHIFVGPDGFFTFDGARPVPIGLELKKFFLTNINQSAAGQVCMLNDRTNMRLHIFYPSGSSTICNACLVYHYRTGKWGQDDRSVQFAMDYLPPGITYGQLGTYYSEYLNLPIASYAQAFATSGNYLPAIFDTASTPNTLNGKAGNTYLVGPDLGDPMRMLTLLRAKAKWIQAPDSAQLTNYYRQQALGDPLVQDQITNQNSLSRFDVMRSARWHRLKLAMVGDWQTNELDALMQADGSE